MSAQAWDVPNDVLADVPVIVPEYRRGSVPTNDGRSGIERAAAFRPGGSRRKGAAVARAEKPAHLECHRRMLAGDLYGWSIVGRGRWIVAQTEGDWKARKSLPVLTTVEVEAMLGIGKPAKAAPKAKAAVKVAPVLATVEPLHAALPAHVEEWIGRLVYQPKADYARAYAEHVLCGRKAPADPGAEWADKVRRRFGRVAKPSAA